MNSAGLFHDFVSLVSGHPLLERLFFASLEFAALAGLVWLAIRVARIKSARLTALLWLVVLAKPIVSLAVGSPLHVLRVEVDKDEIRGVTPPARPDDPAPPPLSKGGPGGVAQSTFDSPFPSGPHENFFPRAAPPADFANAPIAEPLDAAPLPTVEPEPKPATASDAARWNAANILIPLWLTGVAFFAFRSGLDRLKLRRLLRRTDIPDEALSAHYDALVARLWIARPPRLRVTDELESPALIGSLFPTILMPRWLAGGGDVEKIDWALHHELMHWKLLDPPAGLVREIAQGLFYFHPAAWWAGRHWEFAAELACDRAIITDADDSHAYATQLFGMLEEIRGRRQIAVRTGLFATRTQIAQRIAALVRGPLTTRAHLSALAIVAVLAISAVALSVGGTFAEKEVSVEPTIAVDKTSDTEPSTSTSPSSSSETREERDLTLAAIDQESSAASAKSSESDPIVVRGRVLDPDGKPVAGGKVFALRITQPGRAYSERSEVVSRMDVDRDGTFTISLPPIVHRGLESSEFVDRRYDLVAIGAGYGPDWRSIDPAEQGDEVVLRLAADSAPIEGRILDLEGRPVAGVRVRLRSIGAAATKIDDWVAKASKSVPPRGEELLSTFVAGERMYSISPSPAGRAVPFPAVSQVIVDGLPGFGEAISGADGRFRITGIGKDRLATLAMSGETIARTFVDIVTRPMSPAPMQGIDPRYRTPLYFGSKFDLTAEPTQIVTGTVRDADSGAPLRGVEVHLSQFGDSLLRVDGFLSSTSDAEGRYRIVGLPRLSAASKTPIRLTAIPPPNDPYFVIEGESIPRPKDLAPIVHDIRLKRGCWITGRVTDRATGRPVPALVAYYPYLDNPHAREYSNFRADVQSLVDNTARGTSADGVYRIPAIPGRGVVIAIALDDQQYQVAAGAAEMGWKTRQSSEDARLVYHLFSPHIANSVRGVQIDAPAEETASDIELVPYEREVIRLRDGDGRPLPGVVVAGALPRASMIRSFSMNLHDAPVSLDDTVAVLGLEESPRRLLLMLHKERRLGRAAIIERGKTPEVRLVPCATFTGRVVDADGKPAAKTVVYATILPSDRPEPEEWPGVRPFVRGVESDDEGRFTLDLILPGMRYWVVAGAGTPITVETVKPGQTIDVGTISTKGQETNEQKTGNVEKKSNESASDGATSAKTLKTPSSVSPPARKVKEKEIASGDRSLSVVTANPGERPTNVVRGRVFDADDKPIPSTNVYLVRSSGPRFFAVRPTEIIARGKTEKTGDFAITVPREPQRVADGTDFVDRSYQVVALAAGFGPDWHDVEPVRENASLTLRLAPASTPIEGRVVNLEGKPVAGVRVRVRAISTATANLEEWIAEARKNVVPSDPAGATFYAANMRAPNGRRPAKGFPTGKRLSLESLPELSEIVTGADGRFRLTGIGDDRLVTLQLEGEAITRTLVSAVTRKMQPVPMAYAEPSHRTPAYFGATFDYAAEPTQIITGVVRDADTRKPLADVRIVGTLSLFIPGAEELGARTDAEGRYRLFGLPKSPGGSNSHRLRVLPKTSQPYLRTEIVVPKGNQLAPITRDISLKRALWLTGRVTDKETGKPVAALVGYHPFLDNPNAAKYSSFKTDAYGQDDGKRYSTAEDGTFRIPAIAGRGIVTAVALDGHLYRIAEGARELNWTRPDRIDGTERQLVYGLMGPDGANTVRAVEIDDGADEGTADIELVRLQPQTIQLLDKTGEPLVGVAVAGTLPVYPPNPSQNQQVETEPAQPRNTVDIFGLETDRVRRVLFLHKERNLGLAAVVGHEATKEILLEPCATIVGRVVDSKGKPLSGLRISAMIPFTEPPQPPLLMGWAPRHPVVQTVETDEEGGFRFNRILPMAPYQIQTHQSGVSNVADVEQVKPGASIDVGTLKIEDADSDPESRPPVEKTPQRGSKKMESSPVKPAPAKQQVDGKPVSKTPTPVTGNARAADAAHEGGSTVTVSGVVLTPDGKPAVGATVRVAAPLWAMMEAIVGEKFLSPMSETTADRQGRFTVSFPKRPFGDVSGLDHHWRDIWKKTTIAASLAGYGPAWVEYEEIPPGESPTLRLVDDLPIRGRVIDLEGRPIVGTVVKIGEPHKSKDQDLSAWLEGAKAGELPWTVHAKASRSVESRLVNTPTTATTNADGRFEIRGLGRERHVSLVFEGETVAHRSAKVVTRKMEPFHRKISTPPFEGTEPVFGADFTFTAEPARIIEGVVRDAKTREPLAGVSVESYKLAGYPYANHRALKTTTGKEGRFRLVGMPKGKGNRLLLVPNDEQPYFMREVDLLDPAGLDPVSIEIELHRGVWITGRVTDKVTGEPVPGVRLHYLPFLSNEFAQKTPEFGAGGNVDGDQLRYQTKTDGAYRLVGLPGRAIVGANSVMRSFRSGVGYSEIDGPKLPDSRSFDTYMNPIHPSPTWPTMMREVNLPADATSVTLDFALDPGATVRIDIVDANGEPITGVSVVGLAHYESVAATQEPFVLAKCFAPEEVRPVLFHHKERNVGRVVLVGSEEIRQGKMHVTLLPCATVTGNVLNADGEPITGMSIEPRITPHFEIGVRPPTFATDAQGRFRVSLPTGCRYELAGEGGGFAHVSLATDVSIEPGETKELGTITIGKDGKVLKVAVGSGVTK